MAEPKPVFRLRYTDNVSSRFGVIPRKREEFYVAVELLMKHRKRVQRAMETGRVKSGSIEIDTVVVWF
jgi:hypothetical protein